MVWDSSAKPQSANKKTTKKKKFVKKDLKLGDGYKAVKGDKVKHLLYF